MPAAARRKRCPAFREQQPHLTPLLLVPSSSVHVLQQGQKSPAADWFPLPFPAATGSDPSHACLLQPEVGAALLSEDNNLVLKASQNQAAAVKCKDVPTQGPVVLQQALVQLYARAKQASVQDVVHFLQHSSQQRQAAPGQSPDSGAAPEQQQGLQESQGSGGLQQQGSGLLESDLLLTPAHSAVVSQPPPSAQGAAQHQGALAAVAASEGHGQTHTQVNDPCPPWQQSGPQQMPPAAASGPLQSHQEQLQQQQQLAQQQQQQQQLAQQQQQQQQLAQQQASLAQDLLTLQRQLPGAPTKVLLQLLHQVCPQNYGPDFAGQLAPAELQTPGSNGRLQGAELPSGSAQQPQQQTHQPWGKLGSPSSQLGLQEPPPASRATGWQGCSSTQRLGWDRGGPAQLAEAGHNSGNPWGPQLPLATALTPQQALNAALQQQQPDPRSEPHRHAM